jgi:hypothetical protein
MTRSPDAPERADSHSWLNRPPFIDTHRARGVCLRQRSRLFTELARRFKVLHKASTEVAVARPSPDRYIAQLGPVALTVTWLRTRFDSVPEGELLAIVWRGNVASSRVPTPEREYAAPISTATVLWEETVRVTATSEETWRWCPTAKDPGAFTSDELAQRYVDRLHVAYSAALAA